GILLGVIIFGDRIQITPGMLALQAGGIAAMIVGVIAVARAPALSALRAWSPSNIPHPHPHLHVIQLPPDRKANISGMHPHANGTRPPERSEDDDRNAAQEAGTTQNPRRDI